VISSNSSCRSSSEILSVRLGIRVFASSAVSQHSDPCSCQYAFFCLTLKWLRRPARHTQLSTLKFGKLLMRSKETFYSLDIFLLLEACKVVEVLCRFLVNTVCSKLACALHETEHPNPSSLYYCRSLQTRRKICPSPGIVRRRVPGAFSN